MSRNRRDDLWYADLPRGSYKGVFSGGGAKGFVYVGALQVLKQQGIWFDTVVGTSAGAITAAVIAAGADPDHLGEISLSGLQALDASAATGLFRMARDQGFFSSSRLSQWTEDTLQNLAFGRAYDGKTDRVTFGRLYEETGIELSIVLGDISRRRPLVTSSHTTPALSVSDAVVASASIPFAFPGMLLRVPTLGADFRHHTIVDGGVVANFPDFVLLDREYREMTGRPPLPHGGDPIENDVIGFMLVDYDLEEERGFEAQLQAAGSGIRFDDDLNKRDRRGASVSLRPVEHGVPTSKSWAHRVLLALVNWIPRTPAPRWPLAIDDRLSIQVVDRSLGMLSGLIGWYASIAIVIAPLFLYILYAGRAYEGGRALAEALLEPLTWIHGGNLIFVLAGLALYLVLPILLVANCLIYREIRRVGYGLALTLASASSARWWYQSRSYVVGLDVRGIGTTEFDLGTEAKAEKRRNATELSKRQMTEYLQRRSML